MSITVIPTGTLQVNTYIVSLGPEASGGIPAVVVDPGDDGDYILTVLRENRLRPVGIALTHHHFDHVLGLKQLREAFPLIHIGAHPTAVPNFGPAMDKTVTDRLHAWGGDAFIGPMRELPVPDVELSDGDTWEGILSDGEKDEVRAAARSWITIYTPGHSSGSVSFYSKTASALLSGDTMFWGTWGRTDLPDSDSRAMIRSLQRLYELPDDTAVYPGHEKCGFPLGQNRGLL